MSKITNAAKEMGMCITEQFGEKQYIWCILETHAGTHYNYVFRKYKVFFIFEIKDLFIDGERFDY